MGSGCRDFPAYDRAISASRKLFDYGQKLGFQMRLLDIGGGFPGDDDDSFKKIVNIINLALDRDFPTSSSSSSSSVDIISEPGRFFVAAAYTLICKIHAKRIQSRKQMERGESLSFSSEEDEKSLEDSSIRMYYLNDGVYGSFNSILYDHQHIKVEHLYHENESLRHYPSVLWGPTCDALDKVI